MPDPIGVLLQNILFATASLVALTNPLAELPVFVKVVAGKSPSAVRNAALKVAFGVWFVLALASIGGLQILSVIGISVAAFRSAGGLLLIIMGMEMLQGREPVTQYESGEVDAFAEALWVPLVMPMLAGPGAIVATVSLTLRETPYFGWIHIATLTAVTISAGIVGLILGMSGTIAKNLAGRRQRILTRFSGLVLVAIGFQMGLTGIKDFFAG